MCKYKVSYVDTKSHGKVNVTYFEGNACESEVIQFFGLKNSDVLWYRVEMMYHYN